MKASLQSYESDILILCRYFELCACVPMYVYAVCSYTGVCVVWGQHMWGEQRTLPVVIYHLMRWSLPLASNLINEVRGGEQGGPRDLLVPSSPSHKIAAHYHAQLSSEKLTSGSQADKVSTFPTEQFDQPLPLAQKLKILNREVACAYSLLWHGIHLL